MVARAGEMKMFRRTATGMGPSARIAAAAAFVLWGAFAADATAQGSVESDRRALEALYDATGGDGWTDGTNWKTAAPLSEWYGVRTGGDGRVTELVLLSNALAGRIPAELGGLANLERLDLSRNDLSGPIPTELGSLVNLKSLYLGNNRLTGTIPDELGATANLVHLELDRNELSGPIPAWLGGLTNLRVLHLRDNRLTGTIPGELGALVLLVGLTLDHNALAGPVPASLGSLVNLERLDLGHNWGLSGPLPAGLERSNIETLSFWVTRICAPAAWRGWLATINSRGPLCGAGPDVTIDLAVAYTPAAREAAGGAAAVEAEIDLLIAEANEAYAASGVRQRLALVARPEVPYEEAGAFVDLPRLEDPTDGHLDELHVLRDRTGADLVHLIVGGRYDACGIAQVGPFGISLLGCGGIKFTHELGHNLGLSHDRYQQNYGGRLRADPAYGYVNQRAFEAGAPPSTRWRTIMSYADQCTDAGIVCTELLRFSNPRRHWNGDPLGVPFGAGGSGVDGAADAAAVLGATGPAAALWRDRPGTNRPPSVMGSLPDRNLVTDDTVHVDVSQAFADPDGDDLRFAAASSAPQIVMVRRAARPVTLTGVGEGTATVTVTATDPGGLSATQSFVVTVRNNRAPAAVGSLPDRNLVTDDTVHVDVSQAFADPDGDDLRFAAASSAPQIVMVRRAARPVTLTGVGEGTATVTVTATDPGGLSATQSFVVTVRNNRPPVAVGSLPDRNLATEDTVHVDVSQAFADPDGDDLRFAAASAAPHVVTVRATGRQVTLTAVGEGTATVTVTATDPGGLSATQSFVVTVRNNNRAPVAVGSLPDRNLATDDTVHVDVSRAFADPDDDVLRFAAASSAPHVVTVHTTGRQVTLTAVGEGTATVTVTATDPGGLSATQSFVVTVRNNNRAPVAVGSLPDRNLATDDTVHVDVSRAFADPDDDVLRFAAASSASQIVMVRRAARPVTLTGVGEGTATVTVTATDPGGLSASRSFGVTVRNNNRAPVAVGSLPDRNLATEDTVHVDVSRAFADPDGDVLRFAAASAAPHVVTVRATGRQVTLTGVGEGTATVTVTATDPGGLTASQSFGVTVRAPLTGPPFTDDPIVPGVTPVGAVHFTELRTRIDALREAAGLAGFPLDRSDADGAADAGSAPALA